MASLSGWHRSLLRLGRNALPALSVGLFQVGHFVKLRKKDQLYFWMTWSNQPINQPLALCVVLRFPNMASSAGLWSLVGDLRCGTSLRAGGSYGLIIFSTSNFGNQTNWCYSNQNLQKPPTTTRNTRTWGFSAGDLDLHIATSPSVLLCPARQICARSNAPGCRLCPVRQEVKRYLFIQSLFVYLSVCVGPSDFLYLCLLVICS